ncbi:hypothetical protein ONZ43_g2405 [Nemania bipapillata]|uniref:Uncharacterized protein n=1 Tax=Nemania bipapillata TaxID=110536 RepID=A0ACC2J0S0_9PEZI|nr:hypothetical protein ONZ43_g2405 [Nemania bipapillata]
MADTYEQWKEEVEELVGSNRFELVDHDTILCTNKSCLDVAKAALETDDIILVDDRCCTANYTFANGGLDKVIQVSLHAPHWESHSVATKLYGANLVPEREFYDEECLRSTYSTRIIPGRVHIMQPFPPTEFPLAREKTTLEELGAFIAKSVLFPPTKPQPLVEWSYGAATTLRGLAGNTSLQALAPALHTHITEVLQPRVHLLDKLPGVLTHEGLSKFNIIVDDDGHLKGILDFDKAHRNAFGMCLGGLYECFFGNMKNGTWHFYNKLADDEPGGPQTIRQVLERTFWESLWANCAGTLERAEMEEAVMVAVSMSVINKYFTESMVSEIRLSKNAHRISLEYARGILPHIWRF